MRIVPIKPKGTNYSFIHKSIQEFSFAKKIIETIEGIDFDEEYADIFEKLIEENKDKIKIS